MSTSTSDRASRTARGLRIATWLCGLGFLLAYWLFADALGRAFFDDACSRIDSPPRCDWIDREAIASFVLAPTGPAWVVLIILRTVRWWKRRGAVTA